MGVEIILVKGKESINLGRLYHTLDINIEDIQDVDSIIANTEIKIENNRIEIIKLSIQKYKSKEDEEQRIDDIENLIENFYSLYLKFYNSLLIKNCLEDGWKIKIK